MEKLLIFQLSDEYEGNHWKDMNFRIISPRCTPYHSSGITREGVVSQTIGGTLSSYSEGEIIFSCKIGEKHD